MFQADLFKGHRILVTGGGTGLGKAMAGRLLELGAEIVICGRRNSVLRETADELMGLYGGTVHSYDVDLRDAQRVEEMVARIWTEVGPLNGLLNNAAGNFVSRTEDLSSRGFDAIANTVFHGTFYVTNALGKKWIEAKTKASVVSIVTTWGMTGVPFGVPSAMSKAGVDAMTRSLAIEWGRYGIRFNAIAPGIFPTEAATSRLRPGANPHAAEIAENPMGRLGQLSELANLAAFLLADGCEWLTGQTIAIDGAHAFANGAYFTRYLDWNDEQWLAARERITAQTEKDKKQRTA